MIRAFCSTALTVLAGLAVAGVSPSFCQADGGSEAVSGELQGKAVSILQAAIKEGEAFEKVHAAEALIWTGHPEGIKDYFYEQDRNADAVPQRKYRIGIWRTLYRLNAGDRAAQQAYLNRVLSVFTDPNAEDRVTSAETLGKLKYAGAGHARLVDDLAKHGKADIRPWVQWIKANSGKAADEARLVEYLESKRSDDRQFAAYAFRHFKTIRPATLKAIQAMLPHETAGGEVRYYVLGTLYTHLPAEEREASKRELLHYAATGNTDQRYQACMALANWPTADMIPAMRKLLDNKPSDERVGAAYVLLRMGRPRDAVDPNH